MKSKLAKPLLSGACAWLMLSPGTPAFAQMVPLPTIPLQSLDLTNMTFTVTVKETNLTVFITSETRFFKDGKYAISKDLAAGDAVRGTLRKSAEGLHEAVRIFTGEGPAKSSSNSGPARKE